jgi:hypothetical protein
MQMDFCRDPGVYRARRLSDQVSFPGISQEVRSKDLGERRRQRKSERKQGGRKQAFTKESC